MKPDRTRKQSTDRGSVLVLALVIVAIGTMGVLATVSVIGVRALQAEADLDGLDRRIRFHNSKALARRALYQSYLYEEANIDSATTISLPSTWGTATIGTFEDPALSFSDAARTHPTGAAPIRAFSQDVAVQVNDGGFDHNLQFQLRSYNPILAGDLLSIHPTTQTASETVRITGDLKVEGRAVFWPASYFTDTPSTVRAEQVTLPISGGPNLVLEDTQSAAIKPSNYIHPTQTVGKVSSGSYYSGQLEIVNNPSTGINSYFHRLTAIGGEVTIYGTVASTDGLGTDTVPATVNDATLLAAIVDPTVTEADLVGQLAASSPLSSAVMLAALTRTPAISDSYLIPLLNAQSPLPDDILFALGDPTLGVSAATRKSLFENTGFSYISGGEGTVTINLQSIYLPNILLNNVSRIVLIGQTNSTTADAAAAEQPRAIALENSDNVLLESVELRELTNKRRIALALSQTGVLDGADIIDSAGNSITGTNRTLFFFNSPDPFVTWKLIVETQGVSAEWNVAAVSTANLTGGIRADHSIRVTGGTLTLEPETDPDFLESLLSRNAWIEVYK